MKSFHLHLVSDSTGETNLAIARACLVQFDGADPIEHVWSMIRTERQMQKVAAGIEENPGVVLFTLVDEKIRGLLIEACRGLKVPCIAVLDPVLNAFGEYLHAKAGHKPGRQHQLDADYFARIAAMDFAMNHDDGQALGDIHKADVILVGVSRCSKTPTCIYLANRGLKAANVPLVPGITPPPELEALTPFVDGGPLVVGLTNDPNALVAVRRNRLRQLNEDRETDYTNLESVKSEVVAARRLFSERGWPVLETSRRSIEETAAAILAMLNERSPTPAR
ncbi:MAG: kinase/pyrophosphorylase [Alphaproteobacteria bacterium]|nr:kinase/pyrophosphorylase [Alphaproteobacteria bacterium]